MKKFVPKEGQVDFTNIRYAPVINCVLTYREKILIVKRSSELRLYPNFWNGISGFLDDNKNLEDKVTEEVEEETGIEQKDISDISLGTIFHKEEPQYNKTWIVHPVLVKVATDNIKLDWEAEEYAWVLPTEVDQYELLPSFEKVVATLFPNASS